MKANNNPRILIRPDEISIRGLILKLKEYFLSVLRRWWIVTLFAGGLGSYNYFEINNVIPVYSGKTVLLLKLQDLAKESKAKILIYSRFANAQTVVKRMLLKPAYEDSSELLINTYLRTYFELKPHGLPDFIPSNFRFTHTECSDFTKIEQRVFKSIIKKLTTSVAGYADGFINVSINEGLGMITLAIATPSEELTFAVINSLSKKWQALTLEHAVFSENITYQSFREEAVSLEKNYKDTYFKLLDTRNQHGNILLLKKDSLSPKIHQLQKEIARMEVEADIYKINYLATIESLKGAQNKLNLNLPIIEVIEETLPPIPAVKPSTVTASVKGGIMGSIIAIFLIVIVKVFLDILKEEDSP